MRPLLGKDEPAFGVFLLLDERLDLLPHLHDVRRNGVVTDGELPHRDDSFRLEAHVQHHFLGVDPHHLAGDDRALFDGDDRGGIGGLQLLVGQVVDRHRPFGGGRLGGGSLGLSAFDSEAALRVAAVIRFFRIGRRDVWRCAGGGARCLIGRGDRCAGGGDRCLVVVCDRCLGRF